MATSVLPLTLHMAAAAFTHLSNKRDGRQRAHADFAHGCHIFQAPCKHWQRVQVDLAPESGSALGADLLAKGVTATCTAWDLHVR